MELTFGQKIRKYRLLVKGLFSSFERETAIAILDKANIQNPVILDIGANIGLFTKAFANSIYKPKLILSFEPSPYIFGILTRVTGKFNNVQCFKIALSNCKGTATLKMPVKNSGSIRVGLSHIGASSEKTNYISTKIKTERLDDFLSNKFNFEVDIVKMDVEGAEGLVIQGAPKLLKQVRPFWFVEISDNPNRFETNGPEVFKCFLDNRYIPYLYDQKNKWVEQYELVIGNNYLFVPSEKALSMI